ncbi:hypothetical protein HD554DRAFT_2145903 [Boletus coccyginus]|nr:hypothetical protein HD554DRAFT_2145903 [Boletus coccyginus]
MILRVYAMWNQSKLILCTLLFIYMPQVIISLVIVGIYDNPKTYLSVTVVQVLDFSGCSASFTNTPFKPHLSTTIPRMILGVTLLTFALIPTLKQLVEMYSIEQPSSGSLTSTCNY